MKLLAFVHIEKTAGTSFIHILRDSFFFRYVDVRPMLSSSNGLFQEEDLRCVKRLLPTVRCIGGHSVTPYCDFVQDDDVQLITILRDPVNRYLSQYQHWVEKKHLDIAFERFLDLEEMTNFQTKKISIRGDIEEAKKLLEDRFLLVGMVEKFDQFIEQLNIVVPGRKFQVQPRQKNPSLKKVDRSALIERFGDRILENNQKDIELYNFVADELFPKYDEICKSAAIDRQSPRYGLNGTNWRLLIDYVLRRAYIEPASGIIRVLHGKKFKGSY